MPPILLQKFNFLPDKKGDRDWAELADVETSRSNESLR